MALAIFSFACLTAHATDGNPDHNRPVLPDFTDWVGDLVTQEMTMMMNDWDGYPMFSDEEYEQRLREMSGAIQYRLHPMVKEVIVARTEKYRSSTEQVLGLSDIYFPIFEEHLAKYNLPHQLKYLPIIESRLEPVARSYAGAVGLWQFIPSTGKLYNLQINSTLDERSDTYKASDAAARMLSELFNYYGDWALALAAYNCGPGRINRAIKDAGSKDYWVVRNYLPTETQKYVPYFMAVAYVGEYHYLHELQALEYPEDLRLTDTIMVYNSQSLYQMAKDLNMNSDTLRRLNPGYLKGYVPTNPKGSVIVLPSRIAAKLRNYEARFQELKNEQPENPIRCIRRVFSTEDLNFFAKAFRCSPADILAWNGYPANYTPQPGDVLAIRKFKPTADAVIEKRSMVETISIASLRVVGMDKKAGALTTPVFLEMGSNWLDDVSSIVSIQPIKHVAPETEMVSNASNLPITPATVMVSAAANTNNTTVQQVDASMSNSDALDRSRERRLRGAMVSTPTPAVVETTQPEQTLVETPTKTEATVQEMPTESVQQQTLALAQQKAEELAAQQKAANLKYQQQLEQQAQTDLADKIGQQATASIAARQTPKVEETEAVLGIVPTATVSTETTQTTNETESRSRERNLRHIAPATENAPIVAVSQDKKAEDADYIYHEVQMSETIWDIRNKYPQMNVRDILELNQLRSETDIRTGMVLKIRS